MSDEQPLYFVKDDDLEMVQATERARSTFKFLWRELSWEYRRIIPALDMTAVKAPFSDGPDADIDAELEVEQMWISEIEFDGETITGTLINEPHSLNSVSEGDRVKKRLKEITDWMYAIDGHVYGAYSVNLIRSRMSGGERAEHDAAWGFDFGVPDQIEVVPLSHVGRKPPGLVSRLFGAKAEPVTPAEAESHEHPMSANMGPSLVETLAENPDFLTSTDDNGWTMFHSLSLAGSAVAVKILLDHGADRNAETNHGKTPLDLARALKWKKVVAVLQS